MTPLRRSFDLHPEGCVIGVRLATVFPSGDGELQVRGLLDTGASDICIDYRIADRLGLEEVDQQFVGTASGGVPARVFVGKVAVPELGFAETMRLYALNAQRFTHDVLLGRSFMRRFIITFDGPAQVVQFSTPLGLGAAEDWDG